ncbi:unnamed protein product [Spirodela intermedia]|uniref:Uncharacterized protein n=1 Tax=Spirodela intermedia TaxID=51605 RepID=A0A7I8JC64_SPIIN|nr:unnamed protein product [Spirodela intermedia]CAA6667777.1 unnamed protein product [Spirodela intermedia]
MFRAGRYEDAVALFHFFFEQSNIVPNVVSYNFLINTHCDAGRVDVAVDVYRHMLANAPFSRRRLPTATSRRGSWGQSHNGGHGLAQGDAEQGHGADSLVYNNLMAGFIDLGNMDKALELFEELRERCLVYDGVVHATLMEGYFKRGMEKEAMESYQSLLDRQFKMNAVTCNTLLEALLKREKVKEAEALFEHMLSAHNPPSFQAMNTDTYNIMVFHRTGTKPCTMDVGCFNNIISKLCERGLIAGAEKLFEEMPAKSVNPDEATYGFLIDAFFRDDREADALRLFEKMISGGESAPRVNVGSYNKVFKELVKVGRAKGLRPDQVSYSILIKGLCLEGSLDRARYLLEEMLRSGTAASPELQEAVMEAFGKGGRMEEMSRLFAERADGAAPLLLGSKLEVDGAETLHQVVIYHLSLLFFINSHRHGCLPFFQSGRYTSS